MPYREPSNRDELYAQSTEADLAKRIFARVGPPPLEEEIREIANKAALVDEGFDPNMPFILRSVYSLN